MEISKPQQAFFTQQLIRWHRTENTRSLPWKSEKDPYRIWLSEIILQQTRADQGLPYYEKFIRHYPHITDLAAAKDDEVFRLWQGLGYYNRCKNLLYTARYISGERHGIFPSTYPEILALKGVGPYTAAAIASFAYGLPHAVVDGNVIRVLARFWGIDEPWDTAAGKNRFTRLADMLLDRTDSADYNQAIMDIGATVCKPALPTCPDCPLKKQCFAFRTETVSLLPVKSKKITLRKRYFHFVVLICRDRLWIRQRKGKDIWPHLYEPLLIEAGKPLTAERVKEELSFQVNGMPLTEAGSSVQKLTHQEIHAKYFLLPLNEYPECTIKNGEWVSKDSLQRFAFPKTILSFLEKNNYFENSPVL